MKKMKWIMLCMLALPLVSDIKASNCDAFKQTTTVIVKEQTVTVRPHTLIEQILFPHSM